MSENINKSYGFKDINHKYLKQLENDSDLFGGGIDYMRLILRGPIEKLDNILYKSGIDDDNSNFYVDESVFIPVTWARLRLSTGDCIIGSVVFKGVSYPVFLYNVFDSAKQELFKSYGRFDFYGTFWRLFEIQLFVDFDGFLGEVFGDEYEFVKQCEISRIDYKFDLFFKEKYNFPDVYKLYNIRKNAQSQKNMHYSDEVKEYGTGLDMHSFGVGSKSSKRIYKRIYDKLLDSKSKGKMLLYEDYFQYESVIRIERQLMNKFCKGGVFGNYQSILNKFFDCLDGKSKDRVFYDFDKSYSIEKYSQKEKIRYFSDFGGRGYNIAKAGINPFISLYEILKVKDDNVYQELRRKGKTEKEAKKGMLGDKIDDYVYGLYEYIAKDPDALK